MKRSPVTSALTDRLAALSEMLRLRIVKLLERQELSVGEVAQVVQLPQSTVSRHLKVLSAAGWVQKRAEGTATMYRLSMDDLDADARALWLAVRGQVQTDAALEEDTRRLTGVLAERRRDSASFFGRLSGEWDTLRDELFGHRFTAGALLALLPRNWTVADLGCGTGNGAELLAPYVKHVIAVDQSEAMLTAARKRLAAYSNVEFVCGPIESLPLADASIDAATCMLVLHHLEDPVAALTEMRRVTRPGGAAMVIDMLPHQHKEYTEAMGHAHLGFSRERIVSMCDDAGFSGTTICSLPTDPNAKGPGLFVAIGSVPD